MKTSFNDFLNTTFGTARDSAADAYNTVVKPVVENTLQAYSDSKIQETEYQQTSDVFPEDVGMDYYGHYIKIKTFTGGYQQTGAVGFSPPSYNVWNGYLFMPGSASGGQPPIIYDHQHNFTDIRLTNIINDSILGVTAAIATRRSINPMVQVLYRTTNLRQFDFSFFMAPKSEAESASMKNIAKKMRMFSAPEINGAAVIAPAEFEFEFYNKGSINPHLPKIERCVVTKVTANFAPQGDFSSFRNGHPVSCLLQFSASEVRLIDRNKVNQGY